MVSTMRIVQKNAFSISHLFGFLMALIALNVSGTTATSAPAAAPSVDHQSSVSENVEDHLNYFYTPSEFLHLCAQFPSLSVCQQGSSSPLEKLEDNGGSMPKKRKSAYMRFGKRSPMEESVNEEVGQAVEKRKSAYMRFGKRSAATAEEENIGEMSKRKSAYMRFGKRKSAYMRFGKRSTAEEENMGEMSKRKSAYMRFGKRR